MSIYINGIGLISPQKTFEKDFFLSEYIHSETNSLNSIDPDFNLYIDPRIGRRMSRILKQGIAASKICLEESGIENPDAIITGTGLGIVEDTERFLLSLLDNDEKFLNPTPFIQSTHNTISSSIALMLKCHGYNQTYVQRGFSFESTLLDSILLIENGEANDVLIGGFDESTQDYVQIRKKVGYWKTSPINSLDLIKNKSAGTISGEGVGFFCLSTQKKSNGYARLASVKTVFNPNNDASFLKNELVQFLKSCNLKNDQIDVIVLGRNGDCEFDEVYIDLQDSIFKSIQQCYFKHLSGEYHTSSIFAMWLASNIIKRQHIPEIVMLNKIENQTTINNVLIINNWKSTYFSFILLTS